MKMKPVLTHTKVYNACNKYKWFTGGSNSQYDKMFSKVEAGAPLHEIALLIWLCTPDTSEWEIELTLANYCLEDC